MPQLAPIEMLPVEIVLAIADNLCCHSQKKLACSSTRMYQVLHRLQPPTQQTLYLAKLFACSYHHTGNAGADVRVCKKCIGACPCDLFGEPGLIAECEKRASNARIATLDRMRLARFSKPGVEAVFPNSRIYVVRVDIVFHIGSDGSGPICEGEPDWAAANGQLSTWAIWKRVQTWLERIHG